MHDFLVILHLPALSFVHTIVFTLFSKTFSFEKVFLDSVKIHFRAFFFGATQPLFEKSDISKHVTAELTDKDFQDEV